MSEQSTQEQKNTKKQNKGNENDKKNTDAWKEKQAMKKKQKEANEAKGQAQVKDDKKDKKKEKKEKQKEQEKMQEGAKVKTEQVTTKKQGTKQKENVPKVEEKQYKKIETIETLIVPQNPRLLQNRTAQMQLIQKWIHNLIRPQDTVLHLGKLELRSSQLTAGCGKNNYQLVQIPGYTSHPQSQIVCRYEDISYLISQVVDKVFLEAAVIFQNGSALLPKGYENITILANHYNIPLVICSGSWNYCGISIISYDQLQNIFGPQILSKYDWIHNSCIDQVCMEFGSVLPSQISYQVEQGYKNFGLVGVKWRQ